ncbi:MAG: class I SAM-dependent methyltransferase [Vicinamibacterales bacterium]
MAEEPRRERPLWVRRVVERALQSAAIYDLVQRLAGEEFFSQRLARHLDEWAADSRVLDIGGGTGLARQGIRSRGYVCLDLDSAKLRRFRANWPRGLAVAADATACPLLDATFDRVLCAKVVHHLDDLQLQAMFAEIARVLKPGGMLILADAIRSRRWIPRLLWYLDRGSFPRTEAEMHRALSGGYSPAECEQFRLGLFHDVVLCSARRVTRP